MPARAYLRGELARQAGASSDTLRRYERMKVLPAPLRSSGNYRLYPPTVVSGCTAFDARCSAGFSLPELAQVLKIREPGGAPCRQVNRLLEEKLNRLDELIAELTAMREHLEATPADWDERLANTPEGRRCGSSRHCSPVSGKRRNRY